VLEPLWRTALIEGEEELGLKAHHIKTLFDCGVLAYKDYGIHFYAALVQKDTVLIETIDSAEVRWMTASDVEIALKKGEFNAGYAGLFYAMSQAMLNAS
jgi:hypothetical protein